MKIVSSIAAANATVRCKHVAYGMHVGLLNTFIMKRQNNP